MFDPQAYRALARYNRWMNDNLLRACAGLSDHRRKQASGAPFGSIHGLWNHLLVADRIWLARFAGQPVPFSALNVEVCADWDELCRERALTDETIDSFAEGLSPEKLVSLFSFVTISKPTNRTFPFWVCATHFFNHQTHHRGQISALLEQAGGDCGVTDFMAMPGLELL